MDLDSMRKPPGLLPEGARLELRPKPMRMALAMPKRLLPMVFVLNTGTRGNVLKENQGRRANGIMLNLLTQKPQDTSRRQRLLPGKGSRLPPRMGLLRKQRVKLFASSLSSGNVMSKSCEYSHAGGRAAPAAEPKKKGILRQRKSTTYAAAVESDDEASATGTVTFGEESDSS